MTDVVDQRLPDFLAQRKRKGAAGFALSKGQAIPGPLEVVELEPTNVTSAEAQACSEQQNGVVAFAHVRGTVNGTEKRFDDLGWPDGWQTMFLGESQRTGMC